MAGNGIQLGFPFERTTASPIDFYRTVANVAARDAIPSGIRYIGQLCHVIDEDITYILKPDLTTWEEFGAGGGSGAGSLETFYSENFEKAALADFPNALGMALETAAGNLINGEVTARIDHHASQPRYIDKAVTVPNKYQGRRCGIRVFVRSTATAGNVTLEVYRTSNGSTLLAQSQLTFDNSVAGILNQFEFDIPDGCTEIAYYIRGAGEAGGKQTWVDDISIYLASSVNTQAAIVIEQDQYLRLDTANGYGSTANKVRRYSTARKSLGNGAFFYQDSAVNGASITILKDGVFTFALKDSSTGGIFLAITKNLSGTDLTTSPLTLANDPTKTEFLLGTSGLTNVNPSRPAAHWTGPLVAGDIIRPMTEGAAAEDNDSSYFEVTYQGRIKQVNTNPTSRIEIPSSEARLEGASTRGLTDTAIVRFDSISKFRGSGFTISNGTTNGTVITVQKAGVLTLNASLNAGSANRVAITNRQSVLTAYPTLASEILASGGFDANVGADSVAWSGTVIPGDIIRISTTATPNANVGNSLSVFHQEQIIPLAISTATPNYADADSSFFVYNSGGYGSVANKILRFTNISQNLGTDVSFVDSSTDGSSFTINKDDIYFITARYSASAAGYIGISRSSVNLTTSILSIPDSERLSVGSASGNGMIATAIWSGKLFKGEVIRIHTDGIGVNTAALSSVTISKAMRPNLTAVDVTPYIQIPQEEKAFLKMVGSSARGSTATAIVRFDTIAEQSGSAFRVDSDAALGTRVTILKNGTLDITANVATGLGTWEITKNQAVLTALSNNSAEIISRQAVDVSNNAASASAEIPVYVGDIIRVGSNAGIASSPGNNLTLSFRGLSDQILTEPEVFNSDINTLVYAPSTTYTPATLKDAAVGTFITFTYAINTNTRVQTTTAPTQTVTDMNLNGIQLFTRAYNAASTAAQPCAVMIQIGKGMKGREIDLYKSAGKDIAGTLQFLMPSSTSQKGVQWRNYNEKTGILYIDLGVTATTGITANALSFDDLTDQTNGYFVINASKNPSMVGMGLFGQGSKNTRGYTILPGGFIMQWGRVPNMGQTSYAETFPIPFPNACIGVQSTSNRGSTTATYAGNVGTPTTTGFTAYNTDGGVAGFYWLAIGY